MPNRGVDSYMYLNSPEPAVSGNFRGNLYNLLQVGIEAKRIQATGCGIGESAERESFSDLQTTRGNLYPTLPHMLSLM